MKKERLNTWTATLLLCAALICFLIILFVSYNAVKNLASDYAALKNADLSKTVSGALMYNDGLYAQLAHGIETDPADPHVSETMNSFLQSSMRAIDIRIFNAGLIYMMALSVLSSFFIFLHCRENTKKHLLCTAASVIIPYLVFTAAIFAFHTMHGLPFYPPDTHGLFLLATGLLSLIAGGSFLAVLYRLIPYQKTIAILAFPLAFALFLFGMINEVGLYSTPAVESFAYVQEAEPQILEENYTGEAYYDDVKNVMVVEGKEYPPKLEENPGHYKGMKRTGAYVFEALDPWSGSFVYIVEEILKTDSLLAEPVSFFTGAAYIAKAAVWMILSLILKGKTN